MDAMIFKEILQLIESGLETDDKDEKHSCLYRIAHNFNLLVGSPVLNLGMRKYNQKDIIATNLLRAEMRNLLFKFNQIVTNQASQATVDTQEEIKLKLGSIAVAYATKYTEVQHRYMDLLFQQDLERIIGKNKTDLFEKFRMAFNASNN